MKILLINPPYSGNINTWTPASTNKAIGTQPPLGISYIAATLEENGYPVKILDINALNLSENETRQRIVQEAPDLIGITTMTLISQNAIKVARMAKEASGAVVVLGGPHLSIFAKETLSFDFIDYGVYGDGEYPVLKLVRALEKKQSPLDIEGLIYKKTGHVTVNKVSIVENLDELPYPATHLLPLERYSLANALHPFTSMVTTRGCPSRCGFCVRDAIQVRLRVRNPVLVVNEIEDRVQRFGVRELNICNDTLTMKRDHIEGICNEILRRKINIRWQGPSRIDTVTPDILKLMAKAGCHTLRYGVESGNQEVLDRMKKDITLEQIRNTFKWTKEAGIGIMAYFMIGYLDETPETMQDTINFAKELNPDGAVFSVATPLPNTDLFRKSIERGLVDKDYWTKFSLCQETNRISYLIKDGDEWARRALWSFYFRPSYILKRLLAINSYDALKKHVLGALYFLKFRMYEKTDSAPIES